MENFDQFDESYDEQIEEDVSMTIGVELDDESKNNYDADCGTQIFGDPLKGKKRITMDEMYKMFPEYMNQLKNEFEIIPDSMKHTMYQYLSIVGENDRGCLIDT